MALLIRPFQPPDARSFLSVHHEAVRGIAAADYPVSVVDAWAPEISGADIERITSDPNAGTRPVAEVDGEMAGIGEVVPADGELRACYVSPRFGRRGIGSSIVASLESLARREGASSLW